MTRTLPTGNGFVAYLVECLETGRCTSLLGYGSGPPSTIADAMQKVALEASQELLMWPHNEMAWRPGRIKVCHPNGLAMTWKVQPVCKTIKGDLELRIPDMLSIGFTAELA